MSDGSNQKSLEQTLLDFKNCEYFIKEAEYFESLDKFAQPKDFDVPGSNVISSALGYSILIDAFLSINSVKSPELAEFKSHLNQMLRQQLLTKNESTQEIINNLSNNGIAYILFGQINPVNHMNIIKLSKENNEIFYTYYNAGFGSNITSQNLNPGEQLNLNKINSEWKHNNKNEVIYSGVKYKLNENVDLANLIFKTLASDTMDAPSLFKLGAINNHSSNSANQVSSQKFSNCTSRSIREALRDNIPPSVFRDFQEFITNVPYSKKLELLTNVGRSNNITLDKSPEFILTPSASLNQKEQIASYFTQYANNIFGLPPHTPIKNLTNVTLPEILGHVTITPKRLEFLAKTYVSWLNEIGAFEKIGQEITINKHVNLPHIHYDRGYNTLNKKLLIEKFSKELSPITLQQIYCDFFKSAIQDRDIILTDELVLPVNKNLERVINNRYGINIQVTDEMPLRDRSSIMQDWRNYCMNDDKISNITKAHIIFDIINSDKNIKEVRQNNKKDNLISGLLNFLEQLSLNKEIQTSSLKNHNAYQTNTDNLKINDGFLEYAKKTCVNKKPIEILHAFYKYKELRELLQDANIPEKMETNKLQLHDHITKKNKLIELQKHEPKFNKSLRTLRENLKRPLIELELQPAVLKKNSQNSLKTRINI